MLQKVFTNTRKISHRASSFSRLQVNSKRLYAERVSQGAQTKALIKKFEDIRQQLTLVVESKE